MSRSLEMSRSSLSSSVAMRHVGILKFIELNFSEQKFLENTLSELHLESRSFLYLSFVT